MTQKGISTKCFVLYLLRIRFALLPPHYFQLQFHQVSDDRVYALSGYGLCESFCSTLAHENDHVYFQISYLLY